MLPFDRNSACWSWNLRWMIYALVVSGGAVAWSALVWMRTGECPGGSSMPGLVTGGLAGLIMLYLTSYVFRKLEGFKVYYALFPTKYWLVQHVWLGLLTVPLVLVHAKYLTLPLALFDSRYVWRMGPLPLALVLVHFLVVGSGIWGLIVQYRIPRRMLEDIPDETIQAQVPDLVEQMTAEAELLVLATCGPGRDPKQWEKRLTKHRELLKDVRAGRGTGLLKELPIVPIPGTESLQIYFDKMIVHYLTDKDRRKLKLHQRARREREFADLRERLDPKAHPVVKALEDLCERRHQLDEQTRLHRWLHAWVSVHLVATIALILLLVWHVITAVYYW